MSIMFLVILVPSVLFSLVAFAASAFYFHNLRLNNQPLTSPSPSPAAAASLLSPHPFCLFLTTHARLKVT